jgi:hypothetical protein
MIVKFVAWSPMEVIAALLLNIPNREPKTVTNRHFTRVTYVSSDGNTKHERVIQLKQYNMSKSA